MQALIFNSGTGSRMGGLTNDKPKCLIEIADGVTILDLQIKRLIMCGIRSFIITTGKYDTMIKNAVLAGKYGADFTFVNNPLYDKTNYIYSMYLAKDFINFSAESVITLHGDIVFDESVLCGLISCGAQNAVVVNEGTYLSEKDFNAALVGGIVEHISVGTCRASNFILPIYKLSGGRMQLWLDAVSDFITQGKTNVYAEEAFNLVYDKIRLKPFYIDIYKDFCMEIDDNSDLMICRSKARL